MCTYISSAYDDLGLTGSVSVAIIVIVKVSSAAVMASLSGGTVIVSIPVVSPISNVP